MPDSSRRNFLIAGLAVPAAASAARSSADDQKHDAPRTPVVSPQLRYRILGETGLKVTSVGFGCMITSDASVIERAADIGITYFDTARVYQSGNNERMVGAALKGKRQNITLSSKSGAKTKEAALADLDTSLRELGTDHLDIWYLHAKTKPADVTDELIDAQQTAKKAGKIRFAGVSTHSGQVELIPALTANPHIDVILTAYNFSMGQTLDPVIAAANAAGKGIVAMKVMAGGFRIAKPGDKIYNTFKKDGALLAALRWVLKERRYRYHRSEHDRYGSARRKSESHDRRIHQVRRDPARHAPRANRAAILPHVWPVRRLLRQGSAGRRSPALPHLR
jgi:aryl-alcohol dehydrogenase-like predicted oxidoreductase